MLIYRTILLECGHTINICCYFTSIFCVKGDSNDVSCIFEAKDFNTEEVSFKVTSLSFSGNKKKNNLLKCAVSAWAAQRG